ncbi:hypothetical protein BK816_08200 [Boudabousia tangfeifanii]|uniref:Uncharacterized protein n=1 Tax=Boudabousia tangfeifanii TaxID=1912795 RepID=A0A1D9MLU4_9ACTO|nr:hypothetical protein [Boudabousia tangfeifanii]AOZ73266.1 hypothetical protein BK816_08200 [Boudabousia tangfeifanii]
MSTKKSSGAMRKLGKTAAAQMAINVATDPEKLSNVWNFVNANDRVVNAPKKLSESFARGRDRRIVAVEKLLDEVENTLGGPAPKAFDPNQVDGWRTQLEKLRLAVPLAKVATGRQQTKQVKALKKSAAKLLDEVFGAITAKP